MARYSWECGSFRGPSHGGLTMLCEQPSAENFQLAMLAYPAQKICANYSIYQ